MRCLLGLPQLPSADISAAFDDVEMTVTANDYNHKSSTSSDSANVAEPPTATVPAPVSAATNVSAITTSSPPSVDAPPTSATAARCAWSHHALALHSCPAAMHAQFRTSCVDTLVNMAVHSCCPICRGRIDTVLYAFLLKSPVVVDVHLRRTSTSFLVVLLHLDMISGENSIYTLQI